MIRDAPSCSNDRSRSVRVTKLVVLCVFLSGFGGCATPRPVPSPSPSAALTQPWLDETLKRKIECRRLGVEAEKASRPQGNDAVEEFNAGGMHFDPLYAYHEPRNTCLILSAFQMVNLKTQQVTVFDARIKDLLTNREMAVYMSIKGQAAASTGSKADFLKVARELFGDPLPKWLLEAPDRP